jgi:hypothetical protein
MTTYPTKERGAETGSNLHGHPLLAHRSILAAARQRPFQRAARELQRRAKKLFSKADLRAAAEIAANVKRECRRTSLTVGGDATKISAMKASARLKLDRLLGRTIPNYRKLQALQREYAREHQKLVKAALRAPLHGEVRLNWDDLVADDHPLQEFTAPFPLFDLHTIDKKHLIKRNDSYAIPTSGQLINSITYDYDEDTPTIIAVFGLIRFEPASSLVACGIPFTTPRTGRLQVTASLQSFYDEVAYSVEDNFGFSSAELNISLQLFVDVVRVGSVIHLPTVLLTDGLVSHGVDLGTTMPHLDNSAPVVLNVITEETLSAGEPVEILVGSEVYIESKLDDMRSHVNALLYWQLKKIGVGAVD